MRNIVNIVSQSILVALLCAIEASTPALGSICRAVEVRFSPQGRPAQDGREPLKPQIAVWVEDASGTFVADVFVTRSTGSLGLGNRPGLPRMKSDFKWPLGRRTMALPVWAHRRGKTYGLVVMGGRCSTVYPPPSPGCPLEYEGSQPEDAATFVYHFNISSGESYYCSPSGSRTSIMGGIDVVTCASGYTGPKGYYAPRQISRYPPRADLASQGPLDHSDTLNFRTDNDVAAVSGATPPSGAIVDPPIRWIPPENQPPGLYHLRVEVSMEADFNLSWRPGKALAEPHSEWAHLGKDFLGQPSVVYDVPFMLDARVRVASTGDYQGYGDWTGDSGALNPPDATISSSDKSGIDRLAVVSDGDGAWRVKVNTAQCQSGNCPLPQMPESLAVISTTASSLEAVFDEPHGLIPIEYQVRYQTTVPIDESNFPLAIPSTPLRATATGMKRSIRLYGLMPDTTYFVAIRGVSACGELTAPLSAGSKTLGSYSVLPGSGYEKAADGCQCRATWSRQGPSQVTVIVCLLGALLGLSRRRSRTWERPFCTRPSTWPIPR